MSQLTKYSQANSMVEYCDILADRLGRYSTANLASRPGRSRKPFRTYVSESNVEGAFCVWCKVPDFQISKTTVII